MSDSKMVGPIHLDRRQVLVGAAGLMLAGIPRRAPAVITRDSVRPKIPQGVSCGDLSLDGAIIWSRTDRPAQMNVEWSTTADFRNVKRIRGPSALENSDFTAKLALIELPPGETIHYRVQFEDLTTGALSRPTVGRFRVPEVRPTRNLSFGWSGDNCGQGYGINPDMGGLIMFESMRRLNLDAFLHCGDIVYADAPLREKKRAGSKWWRNIVTPEKRKVAETLNEFRGNYKYNLLDTSLRKFQSEVPTAFTWDDHETKNNWWPGRVLADGRYRVRQCDLLAARAREAFFDFVPIARRMEAPGRIYRRLHLGPMLDVFMLDTRSQRGSNSRNRQVQAGPQTAFFGAEQMDWLRRELTRSKSTWKVVASPQPLSLQIAHSRSDYDGIANGAGGRPVGREIEVARLLRALQDEGVKNVVWVTADVHYAAAHHYHPDRAAFKAFNPFWEFLAGPINAGTFGPNPFDHTFGPKLEYLSLPKGVRPGSSPLEGHQFFGMGEIDHRSRALTVSLRNASGQTLWAKTLEPDQG